MKKHVIFCIGFGVLTACSSGPKIDNHKLNCDKMALDSQTKLTELQKVFNTYQDINVDLATKLSQPYKEEVVDLSARIQTQKARCWKDEERELDASMASLKDDVLKIYGDVQPRAAKKHIERQVASTPKEPTPFFPLPPPTPVDEIKQSAVEPAPVAKEAVILDSNSVED